MKAAREAFISSASGAAVPVVSIDGARIGDGTPGPLTRRIGELYAHDRTCARLRRIVRDNPFRERSIGPYAGLNCFAGRAGRSKNQSGGHP